MPTDRPKPVARPRKPIFFRPNVMDEKNMAEAEKAFGFTGKDLVRFALMRLALAAERRNRAREKGSVAA